MQEATGANNLRWQFVCRSSSLVYFAGFMACKGEQSEVCLSGSQCLKEKNLGKRRAKIAWGRSLSYVTTSSVLDHMMITHRQLLSKMLPASLPLLNPMHMHGYYMCIVPEAFLRCNKSNDLSRRISRVLYPTGQGYSKLIPCSGYF